MMLNRIHWMLRHACITKPKQSKSTIMSLIDSIEFLVWCFCNGLVKWTQKMAYLLLVDFGNWQSFFRPDLSTSTKMMLSYADMQDIVGVPTWGPPYPPYPPTVSQNCLWDACRPVRHLGNATRDSLRCAVHGVPGWWDVLGRVIIESLQYGELVHSHKDTNKIIGMLNLSKHHAKAVVSFLVP